MTRSRLRAFVSSPSDVKAAREVAAQVIEKVAHEFARFFVVEPFLWECEPMLASGHFQDSIDPPSRFDIVVLILGSRLGTPLPERTAVREYRGMDGRAPVTGTEWEFEDALVEARERGVPDILVYRSRRDAEVSTWDPRSREAALAQIAALDAFWTRHFADEGRFIGAHAKFNTLEELSSKLEQDLRGRLQQRVEKLRPEERRQRIRLWPKPPFRGLESYGFEHAPIFFGREEAIGSALLRLFSNAEAGRPFLLVLGASGSGKSSLVKAGVVPRLLVPQRVSATVFLRRAVFRPSDAQADEDLFDALVRRLTEDGGDDTGLPEMLSQSMSMAEFARHLREASSHPGSPFALVLDRLAETARAKGRILQFEQAKLILVVDQLEELFTSERVHPDERKRFIQLLNGLVRSGLVWVIATMRSDFWHRAGETPELVELADRDGRLDLLPPTPAELSQMIRGPAEAAGLSFEMHPASRIPLNDLISGEASREPGALPLLSYLLDQLYFKDVHELGGSTLSYASYDASGGLKGAIATRANAVIAAQPPEGQQALRQLLFALVQVSAGEGSVERAVARRAPLSDFPEGTAKRRLINALLDPSARLLVAEASVTKGATVRLAHEALVSEWRTAGEYVAANTDALRTRRNVEEHYARWQVLENDTDGGRRPQARLGSWISAVRVRFAREAGLLADVDLADAERLLRDYRDELAPELVGYIERSLAHDRRRRWRTVRAVAAVAAVMTVLAIGALYEARVASRQRDAALQAQLRSLTQTAGARLREADISGALGIVLEVLPHRGAERSYTPEALSIFQEARATDSETLAITGHSAQVKCVAFSPDGKQIVTASVDNTARIWDAATGRQLRLLSGHADAVYFAAFSPNGKQLVTASKDKTARIWDVATGRQTMLLSGHTDWVVSAAFSPEGKRIVTASFDNTARIWDAATGRQLQLLRGHAGGVTSAGFSPDGRQIVTASLDYTARIWEAATGRQVLLLTGHPSAVYSGAFSPDGNQLVTASSDSSARIWDVATGHQVRLLSGHTDAVFSAAFSPDGKQIITASNDKTARIWNVATGQQVRLLSGHTDTVRSAVFSPDGKRLATGSHDRTARIWDTEPDRQIRLLRGHVDSVYSAAFSPDSMRILTASVDRTARIWDAATGNQMLVLSGHTNELYSAAFSPDGRQIVTASSDKTARLWDSGTGQQLQVLAGHTNGLLSAAFSADGNRIVTASSDGTARIWDATTGHELLLLTGHTDVVFSAAFSPDGRQIVTGSYDRSARVWDSATGRQVSLLSGHTANVYSAAFSPDGTQIVTGSVDRTARLWDVATGQQLRVLSGHAGSVYSARFSPDGKQIVTASDDGTARIWDAATGRQVELLSGHTLGLELAAYSPDGKQIVTASIDNTARVWDARVPALDAQVAWAEAAQFDPLSSVERFQLGLPVSVDVRRWPANPSLCDQSAAAPYDPDRRYSGVMGYRIVADIALAACPDDRGSENASRSVYQHGRALMASGDFTAAKRDFEDSIAGGYRAARVDLATLLSQPSNGLLDVPRAISLYQQAWSEGVPIAAFDLGALYERGVTASDERYVLTPDNTQAWVWYQRAAVKGEPFALARFAEKYDAAAFVAENDEQKDKLLLDSFGYYAAATELARTEDWPDEAWRDWRYRRASLARLLARHGKIQPLADAYSHVRTQYPLPPRTFDRVAKLLGLFD